MLEYKMKMPAQFNSMKNRKLGDELEAVIKAMEAGQIKDTEANRKAFKAMIGTVVGRLRNFDVITKQRKAEKKAAAKQMSET